MRNFSQAVYFPGEMQGDSARQRPMAYVYRYSGLGCMLAAAVLLFMAGGWLLDRWLGVLPLFTVVGALVGAALGTLSAYRKLITPDN